MLVLLLIVFVLNVASSFRGPHHPRSSISHHHYTPQGHVKLTQDEELLHDTMHIKEDLGALGNQIDISKMSEQELEFHYFRLHDIDNNTKLDGLEMLHAIRHTLHDNDEDANEYYLDDDDLYWIVELIDKVLEEDDLDNDGYLGYVEFVHSRKRDQHSNSKNIW
ncbi:PREDICTED: multiple coagulation factor deficiency protein 2 homolog [Ceratosolen solmsi marchali]|uniref:Multiple coagulation factor deficiency protein 2 homolog n=1 Tax=Ceratosolen solmsi marchali TaxID=326594 RepID=A0AAJ7E2V4_9HYME|nr:PREDICTED: multiple coagulation factor deficiency protein 2 homolog [Ceratosolen solmsi marchali]